jgi:hypothetical protein
MRYALEDDVSAFAVEEQIAREGEKPPRAPADVNEIRQNSSASPARIAWRPRGPSGTRAVRNYVLGNKVFAGEFAPERSTEPKKPNCEPERASAKCRPGAATTNSPGVPFRFALRALLL